MIRWSLRRFGGALTARLMQWHAPSVTPVLLIDADDLDEVDRNDLEVASISRRSTSSELREALHRISRIGVASTSSTVR